MAVALHFAVGYALLGSIVSKPSDVAGQVVWATWASVDKMKDLPLPDLLAQSPQNIQDASLSIPTALQPIAIEPAPSIPSIPNPRSPPVPPQADAPSALETTTPVALPGALAAAYLPPPETPPIVFMPPPPAQVFAAVLKPCPESMNMTTSPALHCHACIKAKPCFDAFALIRWQRV